MNKNKHLVDLNYQEAKIYFESTWYKEQIKAKQKKLIELKIIKEKKVLH